MCECHRVIDRLPALLPSEALVEQSQDLGNVELDVFQVKFVLVILLHLEQVIQLQIQLKKASVSAYNQVSKGQLPTVISSEDQPL